MTQRYFVMIFIILFMSLWFGLEYFLGRDKLINFIVIWVLCGFYAGQYSTRFPKE